MTYIIIEIGDEMYVIDQHAAHERIMYEKVRNNYNLKDVVEKMYKKVDFHFCFLCNKKRNP